MLHICLECDVALGMETVKISDALITASTSFGDHAGYKGRLNAEVGNYWRAKVNDGSQYLQVSFFCLFIMCINMLICLQLLLRLHLLLHL